MSSARPVGLAGSASLAFEAVTPQQERNSFRRGWVLDRRQNARCLWRAGQRATSRQWCCGCTDSCLRLSRGQRTGREEVGLLGQKETEVCRGCSDTRWSSATAPWPKTGSTLGGQKPRKRRTPRTQKSAKIARRKGRPTWNRRPRKKRSADCAAQAKRQQKLLDRKEKKSPTNPGRIYGRDSRNVGLWSKAGQGTPTEGPACTCNRL